MNLGAFAVVAFLRNAVHSETIDDYAGLVRRSPGLAVATAIILFSLVGLPPLAGFSAKFTVFAALLDARLLALLAIGGLNTVLSLFYYLRVVRVMVLSARARRAACARRSALLGAGGLCRRDGCDVDRDVRFLGLAFRLGPSVRLGLHALREVAMTAASTARPAAAAVLNRLLRILSRSLPMYLREAKPWATEQAQPIQAALGHLAADQQALAGRVARAILERGGQPEPGPLPFRVRQRQRRRSRLRPAKGDRPWQSRPCGLGALRRRFAPWPEQRALAEEILGNAQGHLDILQDLASPA